MMAPHPEPALHGVFLVRHDGVAHEPERVPAESLKNVARGNAGQVAASRAVPDAVHAHARHHGGLPGIGNCDWEDGVSPQDTQEFGGLTRKQSSNQKLAKPTPSDPSEYE